MQVSALRGTKQRSRRRQKGSAAAAMRSGNCAPSRICLSNATRADITEERMTISETGARTVTACILIIGNEILSGRTQDANLAFLAQGLNDVGIRLREARVIPDDPGIIVSTVNEARRAFDYVFTTGGIGPTHDDITAQCVADAFGLPLVVHSEAKRLLESHYPPGHLNEARLRMAMVPAGAALLPNPISSAPVLQTRNGLR